MSMIWMPPEREPDPLTDPLGYMQKMIAENLLPSDQSVVAMPLHVLAFFNRPTAVELLVRGGMRRRVAKRHVTRILKIDRLRRKRRSR